MSEKAAVPKVQTYGRKKKATAVAFAKKGTGAIKVNGRPLEFVSPAILRYKLMVSCASIVSIPVICL